MKTLGNIFSCTENSDSIFSSFFSVEEKIIVDKKEFYPVSRTNSVVIDLKKLPDPLETQNKRQAKEILDKSKISSVLLELMPEKEIYDEISNKLNKITFD